MPPLPSSLTRTRTVSRRFRRVVVLLAVFALLPGMGWSPAAARSVAVPFEVQSLDGSNNNRAHPAWGQAGTDYSRLAAARYADGRSQPVAGPNARAVSNRVFNDVHQNLFSERRVSQWGAAWGQFVDHTFGLRLGRAPGDPTGEARDIPFDSADPLEQFTNTLGRIPFVRSSPAEGSGVVNARQQVNTVSSYVDAFTVYGGAPERLEWLREGPVDGRMSNNGARLLLPGGDLPTREARGNPAAAPVMEIDGRLRAAPGRARVAGDVRANENISLQATHNLFAREHNRIVSRLPGSLSQEDRFQIARRIVIAEQQYITFNEFLPSLGIRLPSYAGYRSGVNAALGNEFATVGYRAHSMLHGEVELETDVGRYTPAQIDSFRAQGIEVAIEGDDIELAVPLNVAFFNPDLVSQLQLGALLQGIGLESQYKNDEQIDNQLRSVLFQVPVPGNPECLDGPTLPQCFKGVLDLGAVDIERGRDHGMPAYNQLRQAVGLPAKSSFSAITGDSEVFPADPELTRGNEINDPDSLDFVRLFDINGVEIPLDSDAAEDSATVGVRRTPLAARLKAIFGSVDRLDAFTGMLAEQHLPGRDFGELQRALWARQFQALRDGDRFFYLNDPGLSLIKQQYGIDYRVTLGRVIAANTDIPLSELNPNVFFAPGSEVGGCSVHYATVAQWPGQFQAQVTVTNTGVTPIDGWTLEWEFAQGQRVVQLWDGIVTQGGSGVPVTNEHYNRVIAPGQSKRFGFVASWNNVVNARPAAFTLNNHLCR